MVVGFIFELAYKQIIISQHPSTLFLQQTLAPCLPQHLSLPLSEDSAFTLSLQKLRVP
jgi:hypothetical protein